MRSLRQIFAITLNNLRSLPGRWSLALVTTLGAATAVGVLMAMLAIVAGAHRMASAGIDEGRVIVLSASAANEATSSIDPQAVAVIAQSPDILPDASGRPLVQPISIVLVQLRKRAEASEVSVELRGTGPQEWRMSAGRRLVEGRAYRPGFHELIVGREAQKAFAGLDVGRRLSLRGTDWTIVGVFEDGGGVNESSLMSDAETVRATFHRGGYQSVLLQLRSSSDFERFRAALEADPRISVSARLHAAYVQDQIRGLTAVLGFVAYFIGGVIAVGAIFTGANTMYAAIEGRRREIATLRAMGFGGVVVVISVIIEALALAISGGLIGGSVAFLLLQGQAAQTDRFHFAITFTPQLLAVGLAWAICIALLGAVMPSVRAARLPVSVSLRAQ